MRKTLIALAAATGILGFGSIGASALTPGSMNGSDQARPTGTSAIQKADWYSRVRAARDRHERRWDNGRYWRNDSYPRYGYNRGYYGNGDHR